MSQMNDKNFLRSFILSVVRPLKSGKVTSQDADGINTNLNNVFPDGPLDKVRMTMPFGISFNAPKGVTAFFNGLFGTGYENIILGLIHHTRPIVSNVGEMQIYSTDSSGATVKTKIVLTNDGKLEITTPLDVNINCQNVTITASTKAVINSPLVEVGSGALEKVLNGEAFQTLFNTHTHAGNLGYPTSPPNTLSTAAELSTKVKAAK